jgi:HAD superfamily hydrolase (TIGR01509 family)
MIKAIIFDCFGVLYIHSRHLLTEHFIDNQKEFDDLFLQYNYGHIHPDEYVQKLSELSGRPTEEMKKFVIGDHVFNEPLYNFLLTLKPNYKIGLLSNIGRGWIQNFFDEHQLHDVFDAVVLSGDEGVTKPHPQIYELMSERIGANVNECIMIDDLPENVAGADAAGMKGIVYGNLRQMTKELEELLRA